MTPRIAIPASTSTDLAYNRLNAAPYADAVRACGGEPVAFALDLSRSEALRLAESCSAVLLPGSPADVDPSTYGQPLDSACAPADPAREAIDRLLLEDAFLHRKPVLGICFGAQMLNVFLGGTLLQDLTVLPVNHAAGRGVAVAHTAMIAPTSLLGEITDKTEAPETDGSLRLPVNSSHHQAVGIAAPGLHISARCPQDGVIEAIELPAPESGAPGHFVLGVQWHPERTFGSSATSRALFLRLVREAAASEAASGQALTLLAAASL